MTATRLSLHFASISYKNCPTEELFERIANVAIAAEQAGFDALWVPDHVFQNDVGGGPEMPMLEAFTLLGALGAKTKSAHLGALVSPVTFRNPALLAKAVTSLDVITKGRAIFGIGAAWDESEHLAYGVEFPPIKEREDRLEEAVVVARHLFDAPKSHFDGNFYHLKGAYNIPRPLQRSIPIMIAGGGEKRTLRTVARYADICNVIGEPELIRHKFALLREHCEREGRDINEITKTVGFRQPSSTTELVEQIDAARNEGMDGALILAVDCPEPELVQDWGAALAT